MPNGFELVVIEGRMLKWEVSGDVAAYRRPSNRARDVHPSTACTKV
jgi:hypothetical protein